MATDITENMKLAAAYALAELAKEPVPVEVANAYGVDKLEFGREYIIPKPLDLRLISKISIAVAKAAIEAGVAKRIIKDWDNYEKELDLRVRQHIKDIESCAIDPVQYDD